MVLNDVWRTIGKEVGFFYEGNFDDVPSVPGVYAWFYPLRLISRSPEALQKIVTDVQALLNYDSLAEGPPTRDTELILTWWSWLLRAGRIPKPLVLSETLNQAWADVTANDEDFTDFQRSLLKASIFMPPLYVGKADDLRARCGQHLTGAGDSNDFHRRFEHSARRLDLPLRYVHQLIFACVRTGSGLNAEEEDGRPSTRVHELVEAIMKGICAPPYGMR